MADLRGPTGESGGVSSFYVPVTASTVGNGRHVLKNANSFAVLDEFGQIQASGPAAEGLFFEDTRYLSRLALSINGERPLLLLSSTVSGGNTMLLVDLANAKTEDHRRRHLAAASIHVLNEIELGSEALFATVKACNYGPDSSVRSWI